MGLLTFSQLWDLAESAKSGGNSICYHPCCDVWTSRGAIAKRASHTKFLKWGRLLLSLGKTDDKKQALQAKMAEEGWRQPSVLNQTCRSQLKQALPLQTAFTHHQPDIPLHDTQADLTPLDLFLLSPLQHTQQLTSTCLSNQPSSHKLLIPFKRKTPKQSFVCLEDACPNKTVPRNWTLTRG